jgi:rSAM/selenodomain-associated transferase 2
VVIPTWNAARTLAATVAPLSPAPLLPGEPEEILAVDGGSTDGTPELAASLGLRVVGSPRGRGEQLARGVRAATGRWLLLLHADTRLSAGWQATVGGHIAQHPGKAGYFRFALASPDRRARRLERLVAWRCRSLGLPYGDQGLLISRDLLREVGGIRPLPLMEDVDLVRRIGRKRLVPLDADAVTSAERWERDGWHRRSARNLACLGLYFAGMPPRMIAKLYS